MESIHLLSLHHLHARVYFLYSTTGWDHLLGLIDHQSNIYTSQPKYDYDEWFCILMTCTQQWPRSYKFSTLHIGTIFIYEEDNSMLKTFSLWMYVWYREASCKIQLLDADQLVAGLGGEEARCKQTAEHLKELCMYVCTCSYLVGCCGLGAHLAAAGVPTGWWPGNDGGRSELTAFLTTTSSSSA